MPRSPASRTCTPLPRRPGRTALRTSSAWWFRAACRCVLVCVVVGGGGGGGAGDGGGGASLGPGRGACSMGTCQHPATLWARVSTALSVPALHCLAHALVSTAAAAATWQEVDGATTYWLRVNVTCAREDAEDSVYYEAVAVQAPEGTVEVGPRQRCWAAEQSVLWVWDCRAAEAGTWGWGTWRAKGTLAPSHQWPASLRCALTCRSLASAPSGPHLRPAAPAGRQPGGAFGCECALSHCVPLLNGTPHSRNALHAAASHQPPGSCSCCCQAAPMQPDIPALRLLTTASLPHCPPRSACARTEPAKCAPPCPPAARTAPSPPPRPAWSAWAAWSRIPTAGCVTRGWVAASRGARRR